MIEICFFLAHLPLSHLSNRALWKLWFIYCTSCKCLQKPFNKDETNSSILDIVQVSNSGSGILGSSRGIRGLVSISLSSWMFRLPCPGGLGPSCTAQGPMGFACRTQGGCSHRKGLKPSNVTHTFLWKLGSLVAPDSILLHANSPTARYTPLHSLACLQQPRVTWSLLKKWLSLLQIFLFPTSTVPGAVDSDEPLGLPFLYCELFTSPFPILLTLQWVKVNSWVIIGTISWSKELWYLSGRGRRFLIWQHLPQSLDAAWTPLGRTFPACGRGDQWRTHLRAGLGSWWDGDSS